MGNEKVELSVLTLGRDEAELARMGYKQELKRNFGMMKNFGMTFSIISVITGIPSLFLFGLNTGGPVVMVWGYFVVSFFTMFVGLSMAEICSAHPTSGGPYYWAAMLSKHGYAPFTSWVTGWFNLLGQVAVTAGIAFGCATFISTTIAHGTSFEPTPNTTIGIFAAVLYSQALTNTFGVDLLPYLNDISVCFHAFGTISIVIAILAKAPKLQSASFVFTQFLDNTGVDGAPGWGTRASHAYVVIVGILMAQYTLLGYDSSAHLIEETTNAAMSGSISIIMAIAVSAALGWFLILGLLFSIQDLDRTLNSETGLPIMQIFLDTLGTNGAFGAMAVVIACMYLCGTFSMTSNSRMIYAFARDGGIPGHTFFNYVNSKWKSPIRTVWLSCTLSFILGLPSLGSAVAFAAATSIATIGLYISYAIPISLRVIYRDRFIRGPFHLGAFSYPVAVVSVCWIVFISIAFILPQLNPVNSQTFNYASVACGVVLTYSIGFWLLSARKWFTGPIRHIDVGDLTHGAESDSPSVEDSESGAKDKEQDPA